MHDIWNPWHGCVRISEGCANCYMYTLDRWRDADGAKIYRTMKNHPVAVMWTDEMPENAIHFQEGKWGCVVALIKAASQGKIQRCKHFLQSNQVL